MGVAITNISASDDLETTSRGYINTNFSNIATDLDGFPDDLKNLSAAEIGELENIGATTISAAQWGYLGASNQGIATTNSPTFANITDNGLTVSELMATDANKKLVSLAVATYPSLTELAYVKGLSSAIQTQLDGKAATDQTMYIGTTAVAINRGTAALTLAGITLTTPDIGTPSAGTLTNCSFPTLNQNTTGSAATLTTPRTIAGQSFDGSANITIASTDLSDTTTVGGNVVSLTNPSAETFIKIASDNTVSTRTPANVMADLSGHAGAAFSFNSQNLTSVGSVGCGAITSSGAITGTSFGGITSANLVDKTASETITGSWKHQSAHLTIEGAGYYLYDDTYSTTNTTASAIVLRKSGNATIGQYTATVNNELLGTIRADGVGSDADSFDRGSEIKFVQEGAAGATYVPGSIEFWNYNTSGSLVEALHLGADNNAWFAGYIQYGSYARGMVIAKSATTASAATCELTLPSNNGATGILTISNHLVGAETTYFTQKVYAFMSQGTNYTATEIGTKNGASGGSAFTLSMSAANKITVTNDANNGYITITFTGAKPY